MLEVRNVKNILVGILKKIEYFVDLGAEGCISMLKFILNAVIVCFGFNRLEGIILLLLSSIN
jgi:hypothetical protein